MSKDKKNESAKKTKIVLAAVIALVALAAIGTAAWIFVPSKNFTVAFYKIDDKQRQGITAVLDKVAGEKGVTVVYEPLDSEKSLSEQLLFKKNPTVIFTTSGFALDTAVSKASKKAFVLPEATQGMTSSMRAAIKGSDGKISAIPILSSHLEADVDTQEFRNSNTKQINKWSDVEKFMTEIKRRKESPMVFAGGNADALLDIAGAFAESIDGVSSYSAAAKILKENESGFNAVKVATLLCDEPDSPLATTIKQLKSWYSLGLIHQGVFSFQENDVEAFASSRLASILFMPLETHRNTAQNTISRFTSIYFPSEINANGRIFTGKTYFAVPMVKSKKAAEIISELVSVKSQEELSRATGLAPVLAQCRTPDKQADDARYWIAATTAPLAGLSNEVYLTKEQKNALSAEIASRIRNR